MGDDGINDPSSYSQRRNGNQSGHDPQHAAKENHVRSRFPNDAKDGRDVSESLAPLVPRVMEISI
jgi:hypothetical protein